MADEKETANDSSSFSDQVEKELTGNFEIPNQIEDLAPDNQQVYQDEPLKPTEFVITDEPDEEYDGNMNRIKAEPGFGFFQKGFNAAVAQFQELIDDLNDEDGIALSFDAVVNNSQAAQIIHNTRLWANHQDVSDGALLPKTAPEANFEAEAGTFAPMQLTEDTEKRQLDLGMRKLGSDNFAITKEKATRADYSTFDRPQLEVMLSEALENAERLEQQLLRENEAVSLWAAIAEFFNNCLDGEPESQLSEPLVIRIQYYVNRLRNDSWQLNQDSDTGSHFHLPPQLLDYLAGQPESESGFTEVQQLAMYITHLQKVANSNYEDAEKYRDLQN